MKQLWKVAVSSLALFSLGGLLFTWACGSSSNSARLLNALPGESQLNASIEETTIGTSVAYGTASSYTSVNSFGSSTLKVSTPGSTNLLINGSISLSPNNYYTILVSKDSSAVNAWVLTDNHTKPSSGNVSIRVVDASPSLGTADVYILTPGTSLSNAKATVGSLNFASGSSYQTLAAGSYEIYFTKPGQKTASIDSGPLAFNAQEVRTVVGLDGQSGGYTTAVLSDLN